MIKISHKQSSLTNDCYHLFLSAVRKTSYETTLQKHFKKILNITNYSATL